MKTQILNTPISEQKNSIRKKSKILLFMVCFLGTITSQAQGSLFTNYFTFGNIESDFANAIATDATGNSYYCGKFRDIVDFDPSIAVFNLSFPGSYAGYIVKINAAGGFVWAKKIESFINDVSDIVVDSQGNVIVTGSFVGTGDFDPSVAVFNLTATLSDIFVLKLNNNGDFIWAKKMGGNGQDAGYAIAVDVSDNVYTTGAHNQFGDYDPGVGYFELPGSGNTDRDIFISKLDANGNFVWAKAIVPTGNIDEGRDIKIDAAGNLYVTGRFKGTGDFDPNLGVATLNSVNPSSDAFILKLDNAGNYIWAKSLGSLGEDTSNKIAINNAGEVYCAQEFMWGTNIDFDPGPGVFNYMGAKRFSALLKLDSNGNFLYVKIFEASTFSSCESLALDNNQNIVLVGGMTGRINFGTTANPVILGDPIDSLDYIYFLRLTPSGDFASLKSIRTNALYNLKDLVIDPSNTMHFFGAMGSRITIGLTGGTAAQLDLPPGTGSNNLFVKDQLATLSNQSFKEIANINLYPNPTNSLLNIDISEQATFKITDLLGKTILEKNVNSGNNAINLETLQTGIYISKIENENGVYNQKIIKN